MNLESIEEKVIEIVADHMGVDRDKVTHEDSLASHNLDSLDAVEILMEFEREFELDISDEDVEKLQTVGRAIDCIAVYCGVHDQWDKQIEADGEAGKLDFLVDEAQLPSAARIASLGYPPTVDPAHVRRILLRRNSIAESTQPDLPDLEEWRTENLVVQDVEEKVIEMVADHAGVDKDEMTSETSFSVYNYDSADITEILVKLGEEFSLYLENDGWFQTVGDVVYYIAARLGIDVMLYNVECPIHLDIKVDADILRQNLADLRIRLDKQKAAQ